MMLQNPNSVTLNLTWSQSSKLLNPQGEYGEGDPDMEGEGEYEEEA